MLLQFKGFLEVGGRRERYWAIDREYIWPKRLWDGAIVDAL